MVWVDFLRWAHIIGATVLLGTGSGIAFFMVMAHRTGEARIIAHTARTVVVADWVFTASAVLLQPLTGGLLVHLLGWPLTQGWIIASLGLYLFTGAFWLPVVWIQHRLHGLAQEAVATQTPLPPRYYSLSVVLAGRAGL